MKFRHLPLLLLPLLSVQSCRLTQLQGSPGAAEGAGVGTPRVALNNNVSTAETPAIGLLADGDLVTPGSTVVTTSEGEAIFTWRVINHLNSCTFLGQAVNPEGGPFVYKNLVEGTYQFTCKSGSTTQSLSFKLVRGPKKVAITEKFPTDVFIVAGQSNAVGQSVGGQSFVPPTSRILRFEAGALQGLNELGAWASFGRAYQAITQRAVVFIPTSVPGTGTNRVSDFGNGHWGTDGTLFENSVSKSRNALAQLLNMGYQPTLRGVLWVQGENDAIAINGGRANESDYKTAFLSIISRYRDRFGESLPFFIFQTGTAVGENDAAYALVRGVQVQVASSSPYNRMVYDKAITFPTRKLMWDVFHYMPAGYREMGTIGGQNVALFVNSIPLKLSLQISTGKSSNSLQSLVDGSSIQSTDYLKVGTSPLASASASQFMLSILDVHYAPSPVEKGPFKDPLLGTLQGFQFLESRTYRIQAKGCTTAGVCGIYSDPMTFTVRQPTPQPTPTPTYSPVTSCSASTSDGRTTYSLSEGFILSWKVNPTYVAGGQRNKVFDAKGNLMAVNSTIVEWGAGSSGQMNLTPNELSRYLMPYLATTPSIRVDHELMQKSNNGTWTPCGNLSITWHK